VPACRTLPPFRSVAQALSKRIHYGMFVAEAKFRKQTEQYSELIARQDSAAILDLLTDRAVELRVGPAAG
jgi:chorismate mutase